MRNLPSQLCYSLLLAASVLFTVTVLAHATVPWDSQPEWFRARAWQIVLMEVAGIVVLGLLSMGLDYRRQ